MVRASLLHRALVHAALISGLLGGCTLDFSKFEVPPDSTTTDSGPEATGVDAADAFESDGGGFCSLADSAECPAPFLLCGLGEAARCMTSNGFELPSPDDDFAGTADLVVPMEGRVGCNTATGLCRGDGEDLPGWVLDTSSLPGYAIVRAHSVQIDGLLFATGPKPLVFLVADRFEVGPNGSLWLGPFLEIVGAGGGTGGKGASPAGGPGASTTQGGGGSYGGLGEPGAGGPAGPVYGSETLVPLIGGSGGASGIENNEGGHSGGALQVSARGSIVVGRELFAHGSGGTEGGGGGSGGSILLEARTIDFTRSARVSVGGGGGGGLGPVPHMDSWGQPGNRDDSRWDPVGTLRPADGGTGSLGNGGQGSGPMSAPSGRTGMGGGGGAAGRIRLNGVVSNQGKFNPAFTDTATEFITLSSQVTLP